jgi:O-antigen/teichoic acid export membrane protein
MNRNFFMIRSVAFAFVTKIFGGATVFLALPIASHAVSSADYAGFLTTMNISAVAGLLFMPFATLYVRALAHAFATEDPVLKRAAVRDTFGSHVVLTIAIAVILIIGVFLARNIITLNGAMALGILLGLIQMAASWGQLYRIAERSDHVTSVVQMVSNIIMVTVIVTLSKVHLLSILTINTAYFGIPAIAELCIFLHLTVIRGLCVKTNICYITPIRTRIHEAIPLYLSPLADYLKIYASSLLVLSISSSYNYILFSTSILLTARLVNPITLVTRPLMPAFIDALQRKDTEWLTGLKRLMFAAAAVGGITAAILPFCISKNILSFAFPKEVKDVSTAYIIFCSYFAFAYALVALLAPLYIGAHRTRLYGISNLAFTMIGGAIGAILCLRFGAAGMMGSLSVMTTLCAISLLVSIWWENGPQALKPRKGKSV